jgi:hypothetical protein
MTTTEFVTIARLKARLTKLMNVSEHAYLHGSPTERDYYNGKRVAFQVSVHELAELLEKHNRVTPDRRYNT